jgi:hypothetical protein
MPRRKAIKVVRDAKRGTFTTLARAKRYPNKTVIEHYAVRRRKKGR